VVGKVPGEVLPREGNTGILPIKLDAPQGDPPPLSSWRMEAIACSCKALNARYSSAATPPPEAATPDPGPAKLATYALRSSTSFEALSNVISRKLVRALMSRSSCSRATTLEILPSVTSCSTARQASALLS
jgi:hypothetical protein